MDPPSDQSPSTPLDTLNTTTTLLKPILLLAILLIAAYLTILTSSQPGGILHGARVWSRNACYTRSNPQSPNQEAIADENSVDDAPYGTPGIFDDQNATDDGDGDGDGEEDDPPYGPGIFHKPIPSKVRSE